MPQSPHVVSALNLDAQPAGVDEEKMSESPQSNNRGRLADSLIIHPQDLTVGAQLGAGSFATVSQGIWCRAPVAIKKLNSAPTPDIVERFKKEAEVMMELRSPYIAQLYGLCLEGEHQMIVMELMPLGSLYDLLHNKKPLAWETRYQIASDIINGIYFLHHKNIIHRDLKSPNVLLGENYTAKIIDFGFAEDESRISTKGNTVLMGSPIWMAPEIIKQHDYSKASDIFAYSVMLWELVTRQTPWKKEKADWPLLRNWVCDLGRRLSIPAKCSLALKALIELAWEGDPQKRPTAKQAADCVQKIIQEFQIASKMQTRLAAESAQQEKLQAEQTEKAVQAQQKAEEEARIEAEVERRFQTRWIKELEREEKLRAEASEEEAYAQPNLHVCDTEKALLNTLKEVYKTSLPPLPCFLQDLCTFMENPAFSAKLKQACHASVRVSQEEPHRMARGAANRLRRSHMISSSLSDQEELLQWESKEEDGWEEAAHYSQWEQGGNCDFSPMQQEKYGSKTYSSIRSNGVNLPSDWELLALGDELKREDLWEQDLWRDRDRIGLESPRAGEPTDQAPSLVIRWEGNVVHTIVREAVHQNALVFEEEGIWVEVYRQARTLLENQQAGKSVDWTSFVALYQKTCIEDIHTLWERFDSKFPSEAPESTEQVFDAPYQRPSLASFCTEGSVLASLTDLLRRAQMPHYPKSADSAVAASGPVPEPVKHGQPPGAFFHRTKGGRSANLTALERSAQIPPHPNLLVGSIVASSGSTHPASVPEPVKHSRPFGAFFHQSSNASRREIGTSRDVRGEGRPWPPASVPSPMMEELSCLTAERDALIEMIQRGQGAHHSKLDKRLEDLNAWIEQLSSENEVKKIHSNVKT